LCLTTLPQRSHSSRRNHDGKARRGSPSGVGGLRQRIVAVAPALTWGRRHARSETARSRPRP
jgi:hypothetical protein